MSKFKEGQLVECLVCGKGVVTEIDKDFETYFPVHVKYLHHNNSLCSMEYKIEQYTADGRLNVNANITLTSGTWKVEEILPEVTFEKGQPVWVRNFEKYNWELRYYSHYNGGKHHTFMNRQKEGDTIVWKYIKPFEGKDPNE